MGLYFCNRCNETNPYGLASGMCGDCLRELDALQPGDLVTYPSSKSRVTTGEFVQRNRGRGTMQIRTRNGAVIHRQEHNIHRAKGSDPPARPY